MIKYTPKILIAETIDFSPEVIAELKMIGEVVLQDIIKSELNDAFANYDIFWFRLKFRIEESDFPINTRLKYLLCAATGLDHIDLSACEKRGIHVLSLRGESEFLKSVRATAEHTIGLSLMLLRKTNSAVDSVNRYIWDRNLFKGREIYGKRVGILGVGRLGTLTANLFKAFGAEVIGYDKKEYDPSVCPKAESIEMLFETSDIISIHITYNTDTHHLVNQRLLKKMKPTSIIVNTSRGGVIDSKDLLSALQNNTIAGAALDVLEGEPETINIQLIDYARQHSNLVITPHIGGNTYESFAKTEMFLLTKLKNALASEN